MNNFCRIIKYESIKFTKIKLFLSFNQIKELFYIDVKRLLLNFSTCIQHKERFKTPKLQAKTMGKQILGSYETIKIKNKNIPAKIDTGACKSSLNISMAKKLGLTKELWAIKKVKSANGEEYRPVIKSKIKIKNKIIPITLTLTKRDNLKYPMLIGKDILNKRFIVDVSK